MKKYDMTWFGNVLKELKFPLLGGILGYSIMALLTLLFSAMACSIDNKGGDIHIHYVSCFFSSLIGFAIGYLNKD